MGKIEEQQLLTAGVKQYYEAHGPSGIGDRNTLMALPSDLSTSLLTLNDLPLLSQEQAKKIFIHHHFGLGMIENEPETYTQDEITRILHTLESHQVNMLLEAMGTIKSDDKVLDAGSGRAGTAFTLKDANGSSVYGVTISSYQAKFSKLLTQVSGRERTHFILMNMLQLGFGDNTFNHIVQNETDMYILDLAALYKNFQRVLVPGGKFTFATWCTNHRYSDSPKYSAPIDENYACKMHGDDEYAPALKAAGFINIQETDLTQDAIPYWQLRKLWNEKSGVEKHYLKGYGDDRLRYVIVSAETPPTVQGI